ncbi:MAG: TlpA family protein disulfide reductase [Coriobacteriales bacterium]|jgi:thiol-disulfide isomerase/thioredoxin
MRRKSLLFFTTVLCICLSVCLCACSSGSSGENGSDAASGSAASADSSYGSFSSFTTTDLEGNEVSDDVFSKADITVVNFWGTYCNPCIKEMPDLGKWAEQLPDNVQVIGVAIDVSSTSDATCSTAREIVSDTGADYTQLVCSGGLEDVKQEITAVPTTYFVGRDGNILCEPVVGAQVDTYKQRVEELCDEQG